MDDSILNSVKKLLGIDSDYKAFDLDIITHINSVFSVLQQLGIGPEQGFMIEDDSKEWSSFLQNDLRLNNVKTYMCIKVKMLFDPPATSFHASALQEQAKELEWRMNVYRESYLWTNPNIPVIDETPVLDGGGMTFEDLSNGYTSLTY